MKRYLQRMTRSARGELFNPLIWPFLMSTFAYGVGFAVFTHTSEVAQSSLLGAMTDLGTYVPELWGWVALLTIVMGLTFLLFNMPPYGKASGIVGFMVWLFAGICFFLAGNLLLVFALAIPNMWFWIWQYVSLSRFRREDSADAKTLSESNYDSVKQQFGGDHNTERNYHYEG